MFRHSGGYELFEYKTWYLHFTWSSPFSAEPRTPLWLELVGAFRAGENDST